MEQIVQVRTPMSFLSKLRPEIPVMRTPRPFDIDTIAEMVSRQVPSVGDWVDLPVYQRVWDRIDDWLLRENQPGCLQISGESGVGKTLFTKELSRRYRSVRLRLIPAQFSKGDKVDRHMLAVAWRESLANYVELPHENAQLKHSEKTAEVENWIELAITALRHQGFRVVMVVEADSLTPTAQNLAARMASLFLKRSPFQGFSDVEYVLPPWSETELRVVLEQKWPNLHWPDDVVSELWIQGRGVPRELLSAATRTVINAENSRQVA